MGPRPHAARRRGRRRRAGRGARYAARGGIRFKKALRLPGLEPACSRCPECLFVGTSPPGYRRVCWPRPLRVRPVCIRSRRALRPHVQSLRWLRVGAGGSRAAGGGAAVAGLTRHARRPRRIGLPCRDTGCAAALPCRHSAPAARERRPGTQSTQRPLLAIPP
jgi:hypothetical protein